MLRFSRLSLALISLAALSCGPSATAPQTTTTAAGGSESAGPTPTAGDRDGDGILDPADQCPDVPELVNGIDDTDGCPEVDSDRDGIVGSADKCPSDAEDVDGFEDTDGCPDVDGDKDGVADANDVCPGELETINGYKDSDGCADVVPPSLKKFVGTIQGIVFESGSARLLARSRPVLNVAAKVFIEHPEARLEIQGHTDNSGTREANVSLSQQRAEAVRAYLIKRGVPSERLIARGYGPDQPKGDNDSKEGQRKNRRVEVKLISEASN